jgi:hypothetical protein
MTQDKTSPKAPPHLSVLRKSNATPITIQGREVEVWELSVTKVESVLADWAGKFRQHYCLDSEIDALRAGTGLSRCEYLIKLVFPHKTLASGPSVRAGDFAEILVCDYLEHIGGYWVPRRKYQEKSIPNESLKE